MPYKYDCRNCYYNGIDFKEPYERICKNKNSRIFGRSTEVPILCKYYNKSFGQILEELHGDEWKDVVKIEKEKNDAD